jgi:hypothetical protein
MRKTMMFKTMGRLLKAIDVEAENIRTGKALNSLTRYMRKDPQYTFTRFVK